MSKNETLNTANNYFRLFRFYNFTKEMVQGYQPRLFHLTSSLSSNITSDNVDTYAFSTGSITKRNMTILPNDNGQFKPNYFAIKGSIETNDLQVLFFDIFLKESVGILLTSNSATRIVKKGVISFSSKLKFSSVNS